MVAQPVPIGGGDADDVLVVDVVAGHEAVVEFGGQRHFLQQTRAGERLAVEIRAFAPAGGPRVEVWQLDGKDCGLERVEAEIAADEIVVILLGHAVHAHRAQARAERRIARRRHAAVAEAAEVFRREKAEPAHFSHRTGLRADGVVAVEKRVFRADGLRGVLQQVESVLAAQAFERSHVGTQPEKMDGQDRAQPLAGARHAQRAVGCAAGDVFQVVRHRVGREVERHRVDVHEHRPRADPRQAARRGEKRVWRRENGVAVADAEGHQHGELRVGAAAHSHRATRAGERAHGVLELLDGRAEDKMLALDDLAHRCVHLLAERGVLAFEIEQRDGHGQK